MRRRGGGGGGPSPTRYQRTAARAHTREEEAATAAAEGGASSAQNNRTAVRTWWRRRGRCAHLFLLAEGREVASRFRLACADVFQLLDLLLRLLDLALLPRQLVRALSKLEFLLRNGLLRARGVAGDLAGRWGATLPAQQLTRRSLPESLGEVLRRLFWKPHAFLLVAPFTAPRRIVDATHPALIQLGRHDRPDQSHHS